MNDDNRISVDSDMWEANQKLIGSARFWVVIGPLCCVLGLINSYVNFYIPKVITQTRTVIQKVVEYKPYEGVDPDYMAQAIRDFKLSHHQEGYSKGSEGDVPDAHYWGCSYCAGDYDKQYPLPIRIEVRRRLGYLK